MPATRKHLIELGAPLFGLLILLGFITVSNSAEAGRPRETNLSGLDAISVAVLTGGLQYQPPAGLDSKVLEQEVLKQSSKILAATPLRVDGAAPERLVISITLNRSLANREVILFLVTVALREKAHLEREMRDVGPSGAVWVTSWSETSMVTIGSENLTREVVDGVLSLVSEFSTRVQQARAPTSTTRYPPNSP